jgi:hypothetical protein
MTPDQLQQIIDRMTPGPWWKGTTGGFICTKDMSVLFSIVNCDGDTLANRAGVIQLRNHASALVECAKLLSDAAPLIPKMSPHGMTCGNHALGLHQLRLKIDAALERLEEIK